jgi:hypothetical protein
MRLLLIAAAVIVVVPSFALAKPSVAVAPLDGDTNNKVGNAVAKAAEDEASAVTGPKDTGKAMEKLDLSGTLDKKDAKKLRAKLDVEILIQGKVEDDGDDKSIQLTVAGKGIKASKLKLRFKTVSTKFRNDLRDALAKRLAPGEAEEDDEDRPKRLNDNDNEDKPKKPRDDEEDKPKKRVAEDDEDGGSVRKKKKKRRDDDGEEPVRHAVTQVAIRLNAGAGFGRRGLTYDGGGGEAGPPPIGTAAPSARVEVEAYPGAMSTLKGVAAGIGVYGEYDKSFAVSIRVPGTGGVEAPINQQHYAAGVRYRVPFGEHSVAFGVGYAARKYTADRSGIPAGAMLDMPDVTYAGIAPNAVGRFAATPKVAVFFSGAFLFLMKAGPITTKDGFGYAKTLAFDVAGGVDIMLGSGYGMRLAAELSQVGLSFRTKVRDVSAATDRTIGLVASFEVLY